MTSTDFVVTIHAFERLESRFPVLIEGLSDEEQASLVHREVMDAIENGRHGRVPPIELASSNGRWATIEPDTFFVWTRDKKRGYLMREDDEEGLLVVTVIWGKPREEAQRLRTQRR